MIFIPSFFCRARNLFKVFGYKVVKRGRPVRDDYVCTGLEEPAPGTWVDDTGAGGDDELGFAGLDNAKVLLVHAMSSIYFSHPLSPLQMHN